MINFVLYGLAICIALLVGNMILALFKSKKISAIFNIVILILLLADILLVYHFAQYSIYLGVLSLTPFSLFFIALFTFGMVVSNVLFYEYAEESVPLALLSAFSLFGLFLVASSVSLVTIFLGLELIGMPMVFALLLAKKSLESAAKLFIMASIGIGLFSFGMVLVYGATGSLALVSSTQSTMIDGFAAILLIASLGFEASVFPFNLLVPDVYEGAPAYITGMLGSMSKMAGFAALIQILILIFISYHSAFLAIAVLSVLTMFFGNIAALKQKNLKRLLAYSSISQAGYIMIGIAAASSAGITASLVQIFSSSVIFIGLLAIVAWLESRNLNDIDNIVGLSRQNIFAAASATILMLALVGLPFTTGFIGKLLLFTSALGAGLLWLVIIAIINSAISVYYYARPIMAMFTEGAHKKRVIMPIPTLIVVGLCLLIVVLVGVYPQYLLNFAGAAASALFH